MCHGLRDDTIAPMPIVNTLAIALGLAMDAFAVAAASSVVLGGVSARQCFRLSFHFGLFQALMPVAGWLAGSTLTGWIGGYGHAAAFGLLALVGARMIYEAATRRGDVPTGGLRLVALAVATSIDALVVGVSFALLEVRIWLPCLVIGLVAAAMTLLGLVIGSRLGMRFGRRMEVAGGLVLIAIGVKILLSGPAG
jgi:putative Mn2+ efflux pump MntP